MTDRLTHCPVCGNTHFTLQPPTGDYKTIDCGRCGLYRVTGTALIQLEKADERQRKILFQWFFDQHAIGDMPSIDTRNLDLIFARPPKRFSKIAESYLLELDKKTGEFGQWISRFEFRLWQASGTLDDASYQYLIDHLSDAGLIRIHSDHDRITLSPVGLDSVEKLKARNPESAQAFVAMWFTTDLENAWKNGFERGIEAAGFRCIRIDQKEHANKICDEIIAEIRRSRFVVADYTGQRGGVYYEAGFASGLGLPVINTCKKDHMAQLHFDIRQYNCIDWESESELAARLQKRIEAVIGEGPLKSKTP